MCVIYLVLSLVILHDTPNTDTGRTQNYRLLCAGTVCSTLLIFWIDHDVGNQGLFGLDAECVHSLPVLVYATVSQNNRMQLCSSCYA